MMKTCLKLDRRKYDMPDARVKGKEEIVKFLPLKGK